MPQIPNIQKFCGDNSQFFLNWVRQFETRLAANGIEDDRKRVFCYVAVTKQVS